VKTLAWLFLERVSVRAVYLTVTLIAAARLDAPSLAVALAAIAIVGLPQSFGDQAVSGLVLRRVSLTGQDAGHIRRTITVVGVGLAALTAAATVPTQSFTGIPGLAAVGAVLSVILPIAAHAGVSTAILQRAGRQHAASAGRAIAALVAGAIWLPVLLQTGSAWALVGFYVMTDLLAAALLWVMTQGLIFQPGSTGEPDIRLPEILRFMAAVGPANCLYWLSSLGFGLLCAAGLSVEAYAELALYLAVLRVGLDLVAGPFTVQLQVGLSHVRDRQTQDALIVRRADQLAAAMLVAVAVVLVVDPSRVLDWIGKQQFDSVLLLWLLASLPMQAASWLDRPVLIHRHLERTDLHMRVWLAAVDTAIALSSGLLGLHGIGVALTLRFALSRVAAGFWFGARAPHCHFSRTWPSLAFATAAAAGILVGHGKFLMIFAGTVLGLLLAGQEVREWWRSSSTRAIPRDQ
jgi:hypothetical protein